MVEVGGQRCTRARTGMLQIGGVQELSEKSQWARRALTIFRLGRARALGYLFYQTEKKKKSQ